MDRSDCGRDVEKNFAIRVVGVAVGYGPRMLAFDARLTWLPGLQIRKNW